MEGFAYYAKLSLFSSLLMQLDDISTSNSQIFVDICIPVFSKLDMGSFTSHFQWGIEKGNVRSFFRKNGLMVSSIFADEVALDRDVGQRGIIFIQGIPCRK